jgi:hypothetical protein
MTIANSQIATCQQRLTVLFSGMNLLLAQWNRARAATISIAHIRLAEAASIHAPMLVKRAIG